MTDYDAMTDEELEAHAAAMENEWGAQKKIADTFGNGHWQGGGEIVKVQDKDSIHGKGN